MIRFFKVFEMFIQKLEFFIDPVKLFGFLDQGKRKDKLSFLHDPTVVTAGEVEKKFSIIVCGSKVLTDKIENPNTENLREVFEALEAELDGRKKVLENYLENFVLKDEVKNLPFLSGLVGFFSYDLGLGFENIGSSCADDRGYPSYYFTVSEEVLLVDHVKKEMWVVLPDESDLEFFESLKHVNFKEPIIITEEDEGGVNSNLTEEQYCEKIRCVKEYLRKGETYQVNFSQRFNFQSLKSPWEVYKKVSNINPSRHQVFLPGKYSNEINAENFWIVSNSPERLFKIGVGDDGRRVIETRPIKGTIGVKGYESEDELKVLGQELKDSEKDKAELEMIVDMSRNDLGRICEFGTVEVVEHRALEKYSHLLHTASTVQGVLRDGPDLYDIFRALFPGASITGCPKKRTMEIIDRLEEYSRGVYCGSMGYLDCRGGADFNIMIRTLFAKENRRAGFGYVMHSGGGIVYDSTPELEFKETFDKVNAFLHAIKEY